MKETLEQLNTIDFLIREEIEQLNFFELAAYMQTLNLTEEVYKQIEEAGKNNE